MNQTRAHSLLCGRIQKALRSIEGVDVVSLQGSSRLPVGTPDLLVVAWGRAVFLEVKTGAAEVEPAQAGQMARWRRAGAVVQAVWSVDEAVGLLPHN